MMLSRIIGICVIVAFGSIAADPSGGNKIVTTEYDVNTSDGYILKLFHMKKLETRNRTVKKVLLISGFQESSDTFVYGGAREGLALALAEDGFHVFLANTRGTVYGLAHETLNPLRDEAFWDFSWDEVASKDLTAIIDKTDSVVEGPLHLVGHLEGATAYLILASKDNKYTQKISKVVALGPIVELTNSKNTVVNTVAAHLEENDWLEKNVGRSYFQPSVELLTPAIDDCVAVQEVGKICHEPYFLVNGYNSNQLNKTTLDVVLSKVSVGGSVDQLKHLAVWKHLNDFVQYPSQSQRAPSPYELQKLTNDILIIYAPNDNTSTEEDINILAGKLTKAKVKVVKKSKYTNNIDLVWGVDVSTEVNEPIIEFLTNENSKNFY